MTTTSGVYDLPCFTTLYFYDPLLNLIFPYTCNFCKSKGGTLQKIMQVFIKSLFQEVNSK